MNTPNSPILVSFITAIIGLLLFFAILLPLMSLVINLAKRRVIETGETALRASFIMLFLAIVCSSFLLIAQDPTNIIGAILNGIGLSIGLLVFFVITLLQIRMVKGKGSVRKFLGFKERGSKR
jgi:hypothetical protein